MARNIPVRCPVLILCDSVEIEQQSSKPTIRGAFFRISADAFPVFVRSFAVYFEIEAALDVVQVSIRFVRKLGEADSSMASMEITVPCDEQGWAQSHGQLTNFPFQEPGEYGVVLEVHGVAIARRALFLSERKR